MVCHEEIGGDFGGTLRYLHQGRRSQPTAKEPELLGSRGIGTGSVEEMIHDFNQGRQANPRLGKAVWHISLSFNPADAQQLDSQRMLFIAEEFLQKRGLGETQYLILRHHDTPDNKHVHLVVNRVNDEGKTITDSNNYYRSQDVLRELVQRHGLTPPGQGERGSQHPERLQGAAHTRHELRQALAGELATATQLPELGAALRVHGVETRYRYNQAGEATGISFAKDGMACKGSELAPGYSLRGIEQQLAANRQQQASTAREAAATVVRPAEFTALPVTGAGETPVAEPAGMEPAARLDGATAAVTLPVRPAADPTPAAADPTELALPTADTMGRRVELPLEYEARLDQARTDWEAGWTPERQQAAWDEDWDQHCERVEQAQLVVAEASRLSLEQGVSFAYLLGGHSLELTTETGEVRVRHQITGDLFTGEEVPVAAEVLAAPQRPSVQYGRIELDARAAGSGAERLARVYPELARAGLLLGQVMVEPGGAARLDYCFPVPKPGLQAIARQLGLLQYEEQARLYEAPHPLHALPATAAGPAAVGVAVLQEQWPERNGQFNQVYIEVTGTDVASAERQAERIQQVLREEGARVSKPLLIGPASVSLEVIYHTHSTRIEGISATLNGAANIQGVVVRENEQQQSMRLQGVRDRAEATKEVFFERER